MTSSSSSSQTTPFTFSQSWNNDVFLSFQGEDTRKTFVDHLYSALVQQGIHTFKDDETLRKGQSIAPSLLKAIQESQVAIIVFSKNYVYSSWCLDELACIIKCMNEKGQTVFPIFYEVDPSEVRKQTGKYGEALNKHEVENSKKVETWKKALLVAGNLSGWVPKNTANGNESKCIEEIVDTISHCLHPVTSSVNDKLVGAEARIQHLKSKLQIGLGGVLMIGIWGVGGGGKTTLASCTYDEISWKFDGSCFVENIREESSKNGLQKLQENIISSVLKQSQVHVRRVEDGKRMIMSRLFRRKVLIVLDDVDHLDHLEALAGSHAWFGEGSRIIITTRDEHLLNAHKVNLIHNISLLNDNEASNLFWKHAPRDNRPMQDYELLSKDVVSYAGGLPLALKVLGCFLGDKDMNEWRSALARLKEIPDANIIEKLKISFDGLSREEKELFLDIACFFRRRYKDEWIMMILDACGFHPVIGIKVLIQKALITISDGKFDMHDLIQEMAHYIVRGEYPNNPHTHSRIWKKEDVLNICVTDVTTKLDKIEAIKFLHVTHDESQIFLEVVANMKRLRWIDLNIDTRSLLLMGVETTCTLPENFPPRELRCLTMSGLRQNQLWEGYKYLPNLRMIKLDRLTILTMTPDFDGLPNLERFMVNRCPYLQEIQPSFGHLEKLVGVAIERCENLKMVPLITLSNKLETLIFSGCTSLFSSLNIQQNMRNLEHLHLDKSGKNVASYNQYLAELEKVTNAEEPALLHKSMMLGLIVFQRGLRKLHLSYCNLRDGDINRYIYELPNLQELDLSGNEFARLSFSRLQLPKLKWLNVSCCEGLVELSELPSSLAVVIAEDCTSLETFGDISYCTWLWKVTVIGSCERGPFAGDILLRSMLQGNARDHFISVTLSDVDVWMGFVARLDWGKTFTKKLPHNWYNDFCGLLMFIGSGKQCPHVNIIIKHGLDHDIQSELLQESNEIPINYFHETTSVGYVSFTSLRQTTCLNSTYDVVSFSLGCEFERLHGAEGRFSAALVPRRIKDDEVHSTKVATDCSEFYDEEVDHRKAFTIQHDSRSSIKILWCPWNNIL